MILCRSGGIDRIEVATKRVPQKSKPDSTFGHSRRRPRMFRVGLGFFGGPYFRSNPHVFFALAREHHHQLAISLQGFKQFESAIRTIPSTPSGRLSISGSPTLNCSSPTGLSSGKRTMPRPWIVPVSVTVKSSRAIINYETRQANYRSHGA